MKDRLQTVLFCFMGLIVGHLLYRYFDSIFLFFGD